MTVFKKRTTGNHCPYCAGQGYFQLRLGGSETCSCCSGSGKNK
ncbi:YuiA family protein [Planococcus sp. SSTMD024]